MASVGATFKIVSINYAGGTMPTSSSAEGYINIPSIGANQYLFVLGTRVLRKADGGVYSGVEYDINTVGALVYQQSQSRFLVYINPDMVPYVGGEGIGVIYAIFEYV